MNVVSRREKKKTNHKIPTMTGGERRREYVTLQW